MSFYARPYYLRVQNLRRPLHRRRCGLVLGGSERVNVVIALARENLAIERMPATIREPVIAASVGRLPRWAVRSCFAYHVALSLWLSAPTLVRWPQSPIAAAIAPGAGRNPGYIAVGGRSLYDPCTAIYSSWKKKIACTRKICERTFSVVLRFTSAVVLTDLI